MKEYLSVNEVSEIYKISTSTIYRLTRDDPSFPAINVGLKKKIIVKRSDLSSWIKNRNFKEEIICLPSNTIVFRRRIHEETKRNHQSASKW